MGSFRRRAAVWALVALAASACGQVVELELPQLDAVPRDPPEQTFVYDADGNQLAVLRREFRERVALDEIPGHLVDAVIAAEDQRFEHHGGLDARAIARALLTNVAAGDVEQGGSTITQQLVKNLYMPDAPRTPETKLREALLARQIEEEHGKDWILEEYLNTVYFGNGAYGVQAAARTYWRKDTQQLTLAEGALLAGLIRAPESLDPEQAPEAARHRREQVLTAMVELGRIGRPEADAAAAAPIAVEPRPTRPATVEPHWVDFVVRTLLSDPSFGATEAERATRLYGGGLRIHTTLRPHLQAAARDVIAARLPDAGDPEAAIVTVEPSTGHILAAAHALPYEQLQFDLATQARRQPGSTFKTFVLAAAVSSGYGPRHPVNGNQGTLRTPQGVEWRVRNYARASYGMIPLREATRASVNAAFARLILELGVGRVAAQARSMGVSSPIDELAPIALGGLSECCTPLDMAASYATLANLGQRVPATPIDHIDDADGQVVWRPPTSPRAVLVPSAAYVVTDMLVDVVDRGTGTRARIPGWQVAGKTGTVSDYTDAWFVGYTATLSTSVWVGHDEGRIELRNVHGVRRVTGGSIPAAIWRDYMVHALAGQEPVGFVLPQDHYEVVELDPSTGLLAAPWCRGEPTPVPRVIVPREVCPSPSPTPTPTETPTGLPTGTASPTEGGSATPGPTASGPTGSEPTPAPTGASPSPSPGTSPAPARPSPTPTGGG